MSLCSSMGLDMEQFFFKLAMRQMVSPLWEGYCML